MEERVIEKIKRLLALSNSSNEHEARLAAERASEIMLKYNLSMQDIKSDDKKYVEETLDLCVWEEVEERYVCNILTNFFFVDCLTGYFGRKRILYLLGRKDNVEVAHYMYEYLMREFRNCWMMYKITKRCNENVRDSYYIGMFSGLNVQLNSRKRAVEKETGLVVVKDADLEKWKYERHPNIKKGRSCKLKNRDWQAENDGYSKGKELQINAGIRNRGESAKLKLIENAK